MRAFIAVLLVVAAVAAAEEPPAAVQTGPGRRVIAADDSTGTLAAIGPDGRVEWKLPCRQIHDLHLLPGGNTRFVNCHAGPGNPQIIEVTPDKEAIRTFKDFKTFGNSLPVAMVLDP